MNKNELKNEFFKILESYQKCYKESKKLKVKSYFCGDKTSLINDFMNAFQDDDYKLMNKINGAMVCCIKSYEIIKRRMTNNDN